MKRNLAFILSLSLLTGYSAAQDKLMRDRAQRARQVNLLYQQAEVAWKEGEAEIAQKTLQAALAINPNHAPSYALVQHIKANSNAATSAKRKRLFSSTMLQVVDFNDIPLDEAIRVLGKLIEKQSDPKFQPNFVIQDPHKSLGKKKVNLQLKGVPASVVLDYLLSSVDAVAQYDAYATVIRPKNAGRTPPAASKNNGSGL